MKTYFVRIDNDGMITSFEPIKPDELLDAVMRDFMKETRQTIADHKKCIQDLEGRIKELEKRKDTIPFVPIQEKYPDIDGWRLEPPFVFTCRY